MKTPLFRVHPRIRGEYARAIFLQDVHPGSPPHPRGISLDVFDIVPPYRFTPASAGNIGWLNHIEGSGLVHPRIRGEYGHLRGRSTSKIGSPPHPRGIFFDTFMNCFRLLVHPRIRGEYLECCASHSVHRGSPPHPRGICVTRLRQIVFVRFTPASAGNILNKSLFFLTFLLITLQISFNFL